MWSPPKEAYKTAKDNLYSDSIVSIKLPPSAFRSFRLSSIRKKLGIQFVASNGATITYFLMSLVLSRILSPSEIGIFSITAVLVGFTHVFRDFGVSSFIRRQKVLTNEIVQAATGVLFTSSWIIAVLLYVSAQYWANFFKQPGIVDIMHIQAIGFLIIPFGSIPSSILARAMDVEKTSIVIGISVVVYASTCITLAYMGFSYMSMAWANLLNIIVSSIGFMLLRPKGIPWKPSFKGWKQVAHFGAGAMSTSALQAVDIALPDLILGRISGPHNVGIFSRGNSTVNIFNTIAGPTINYFSIPYLAKAHHGGENVGKEVARTISFLTGIMWPALVATAILAKDIIRLLYGPNWAESADVVPWLCLAAAVQIGFLVLEPALIALNKPYLSAMQVGLIVLFKIILGVYSFSNGDLISFARAVAIAEFLAFPVQLYLLQRYVGLRVGDWVRSVAASIKLSVLLLVFVLLFKLAIQPIENPLLRILLAAVCLTPSWIFGVFLTRHPLAKEVTSAWHFAKSYFLKKGKAESDLR